MQDARDFALVLEKAQESRLIWVSRPIVVHRRAEDGEACDCGCNSKKAVRKTEPERHIDLLIDRVKGSRRLRSTTQDGVPRSPDEIAAFDKLCEKAIKVDMPLRCYEAQYPMVKDRQHKIIGAFGGNRSGKTTAMVEWLVDQICERGGPSSQFWWVAPTREKTRIGVRKLVTGEKTDRFVKPVLPSLLVRSYPDNERSAVQEIRLIDGSTVYLKYGGRDGGNLKGDPAQAIGVDEGCELRHIENWTIMVNRLMDSGGQIFVATTPIAGHWLKEEVADRGKTYEEAASSREVVDIIAVNLSCFDNPFVSQKEIERTIRSLKDEQRVQREVFGKWVGAGPTLWSHFREKPDNGVSHVRHGGWWDVDGWGLVNITPMALSHHFHGTSHDLDRVGGMDFNIWPMSVVVGQVACPAGADQADPRNWILFILDEVVKKGNVFDFRKHLATKAGAWRSLKPNYYAGLPIICDATGAQDNPPAVHGITDRGASLARAMNEGGFDCRPCHYSEHGHPVNPSIRDRVSLMHHLMTTYVEGPQGSKWPRVVVHGQRCERLLHSLRTQEANEKGMPLKEPGTASDRLSGPTDALGYLAWAIFSSHDLTNESPEFL